jgi:hypothetical protein
MENKEQPTEKEILAKRKVVQERVESVFSSLKKYGYTFEGANDDTSTIVKYCMRFWFANKDINRRVEVYYQPIDIEGCSTDVISVEIQKINDPRNHIVLIKLLNSYSKGVGVNEDYLFYINHGKEGCFQENLEKTLNLNLMYLLEIGKTILAGKDWEEGMVFRIDDATWDMLYEEQRKIIYSDKNRQS